MKKIAEKSRWVATGFRWPFSVLIIGSCCVLFWAASLADEAPLPSGQGYMLIRIKLNQGERVGTLAMSSVDTNEVIRYRTNSFEPAGSSAWMALVAMPAGRYFWSEYETSFGTNVEASRNLTQMYKRNSPGSASDTFEIVSGVINYVGDWVMRVVPSHRSRLDPIIDYDKSTLERYLEQYPEHANKYEVYLSIMGKEAISLQELSKLAAE